MWWTRPTIRSASEIGAMAAVMHGKVDQINSPAASPMAETVDAISEMVG